jgi:hypothetical protein
MRAAWDGRRRGTAHNDFALAARCRNAYSRGRPRNRPEEWRYCRNRLAIAGVTCSPRATLDLLSRWEMPANFHERRLYRMVGSMHTSPAKARHYPTLRVPFTSISFCWAICLSACAATDPNQRKQGLVPSEVSYRGTASGMRTRRTFGTVSALDAQRVNALAYHDLARREAGYLLTRTGRPGTIAV